jgi:hypothetical protein
LKSYQKKELGEILNPEATRGLKFRKKHIDFVRDNIKLIETLRSLELKMKKLETIGAYINNQDDNSDLNNLTVNQPGPAPVTEPDRPTTSNNTPNNQPGL